MPINIINKYTKYMSNKRENFEKIATGRVQKILKNLELLGNCSNTSYYDYNKDDVDKIFKAISKKLNATKSQYYSKMNKNPFEL